MKHPDHDHQLPLLSFLLVITGFTLIHIPISSCQNQEYDTCEQVYRCGMFEFRYPFWAGSNRPDYCGYPGFEVSCLDNLTPRITISSIVYRVVESPNTGDKTVQLARDDLFANSCVEKDGDGFNTSMFSYSNTQNLTILYNCLAISSLPQTLNRFACNNQNGAPTSDINYFILSNAFQSISNPPDQLESCRYNITVPVERNFTAVVGGALPAARMIGFPVGYIADNDDCDRCSRGNGTCGYNTVDKSFACYCRDGQNCYSESGKFIVHQCSFFSDLGDQNFPLSCAVEI